MLEADIYRSDFDFTSVKRLKHRPDEELLLRALVQTFLDHSLCTAEDRVAQAAAHGGAFPDDETKRGAAPEKHFLPRANWFRIQW